jgi:short-subunit dehydrogenase
MTIKEKYGPWALVTGASSGIGEEFARKFAAQGMNLILVARRKERLEILSQELTTNHNIKIVVAPVDLTTDNFIQELKKYTSDIEIGILINNAGIGSNGEFINANPVKEAEMVKLNCLAPTILTHYFVKQMVERKRGAIIFLGSVVGFQPTPFMATYSATKAFNSFLGDALWYELKKYKIDVLSLNPGGTDTEFQRITNSHSGPVPRTTEQVVTTALKALGSKPGVVDVFYNKVLAVSSRFGSRKFVVKAAGFITKSLYRKKK